MILVLIITLILSAFFSATEIVFITANRLRIQVGARRGLVGGKTAEEFVLRPERFLAATLVGNNLANVLFSSVAALFLKELTGMGDAAIMIVVTAVLLTFGEIIPKSLGRSAADGVIRYFAAVLRLFSFILYPVIAALQRMSEGIVRLLGGSAGEVSHFFHRTEIDVLIRQEVERGSLDDKQGEIISKIVTLSDRPIREVMVPRTEIVGVDVRSRIREVYRTFVTSGYSQLPVYDGSIDKIVGIVGVRDLFARPRSLKSVMRDVLFVPATKRAGELLREFREKGSTFAVVVDEFGGTAGIVTSEDLVEEVVGEIHDEYDVEESVCREVEPSVYLLSGRVELDRVREELGIALPEGDYETVGGFIVASVGRIPRAGEELQLEGYKVVVLKGSRTKVDLVKLFRLETAVAAKGAR